ncbi:MAG: DEAD/DEAH box helicase family protein [Coleofasciculaceae cyanobacterium]
MTNSQKSHFYREFDLKKVQPSHKVPANHQNEALAKLKIWFKEQYSEPAGGILALPTGGGKTFTASRFLCSSLSLDSYDGPVSKGYKVLWLAHTKHLLEQAFYSFESEVGRISEQKQQLNVRVVSPGHQPVHSIKPSDDVVIITLQTLRGAYNRQNTQLEPFLKSAGDKLFVVFDEAHHSPAYSYRKLMLDLRKRFSNKMWLLGLTATPTYTDESRRGWLRELFPQEVIYPKNAEGFIDRLIGDGILAKPEFEEHPTNLEVEFDEQEYKKWVSTYKDLPEDIIKKLAENEERNQFIADTYVKNKERYKKTIIFADRWYQCEALCKFLEKRGVKAGAIYTKVDKSSSAVIADHQEVLEQFRNGDLEVLINIQMLTEGTDVPNAQTVFLTRQTTSNILITQMIGRALRGPQFGGTNEAYIVSFIDNWKQVINWGKADFSGGKNDDIPEYGGQAPLDLISIELVRRWADQVAMGEGRLFSPFLTLLPLGWYLLKFQTVVSESEDNEVLQLLLVFDNEKESYEKFIQSLTQAKSKAFAEIDVSFEDKLPQLEEWKREYFKNSEEYIGANLLRNIFHIARHVAQNNGEQPRWFDFEQRGNHNLDTVAEGFIKAKLDRIAENQKLQIEYKRTDRYWNVIYQNYIRFKEQYDVCVNRLLNPLPEPHPPNEDDYIEDDEPYPPNEDDYIEEVELTDETKRLVKKRDGKRCLCCGEKNSRLLQVDHIKPRYYGGAHSLDNLQTLCRQCNQIKGTETIDFRIHKTPLTVAPVPVRLSEFIKLGNHKDGYKLSLRRSLNFFYRCAAVNSEIKVNSSTGENLYRWDISLYADNNPGWVIPYLKQTLREIRQVRSQAGVARPKEIVITAPGFDVFDAII